MSEEKFGFEIRKYKFHPMDGHKEIVGVFEPRPGNSEAGIHFIQKKSKAEELRKSVHENRERIMKGTIKR